MKKLSKKMKQLLTLMLAIAMIVTTVPQTGMQVSAAGLEVAETGETNITQETSKEDVEEASDEESKEESDSDNRTEETPDNEDENLGGVSPMMRRMQKRIFQKRIKILQIQMPSLRMGMVSLLMRN